MVDPWILKAGPIGLARARVIEVPGFRRWWWRLWLRVAGDPLALPAVGVQAGAVVAPRDLSVMHFAPGSFRSAICKHDGVGARTTTDFDSMVAAESDRAKAEQFGWIPCPSCLDLAGPLIMQYRLNTR